MAKVKDPLFPFVGTVGGLNFYFLDGKPIVRRAGGGFSATVHKKSDRIKENKSEFALAARPNKDLRMALRPLFLNFKVPYLHSRLQGAFVNMRAFAKGARGKRHFYGCMVAEQGLLALQAFDYTPLCPMETSLPYTVVHDKDTHALKLSGLKRSSLTVPEGATHLRLRMTVVRPDAEAERTDSHPSEEVFLDLKALPKTLTLTPKVQPPPTGSWLVYVGAWFQKEEKGRMAGLYEKHALGFWCVGYGVAG